jgi:hypothetical protein
MNDAQVFLQSFSKPMLLLHACVALAGAGACTHMLIVSVRMQRGAYHLARLARVYAQVIGGTYVGAFALGLLLYPAYRYFVRGIYLDRYEPWASNLFDIKENLTALGLPMAMALFFIGRTLDPQRDRAVLPWMTYLAISVWVVVVSSTLLGLLVTSVKGV